MLLLFYALKGGSGDKTGMELLTSYPMNDIIK